MQIRLTAQRIYNHLAPADRARLDDYARGVNLYIAQCEKSHTLPPEFRLLGYHPQAWTGVDSVSVGLMMVETLDSRITTKISRAHVEAKLNDNPQLAPQLIADLYPIGSWRDHPPTGIKVDLSAPQPQVPPSKNEDDDDENTQARINTEAPDGTTRVGPSRASSQFASKTEWGSPEDPAAMLALSGHADCENCAVGSNNWVVAGSHTASGKPLLSNDMHSPSACPTPGTWPIYIRPVVTARRLSRRRRHAARPSLHHRRPQRARGLGIHRALRRRAGSLHREARRQGQLPGQRRPHGIRSPWITK